MQYKVYKQFPRDEERLFAQFNDLTDAKFFIEKKVEADQILKTKVIYRLYKGHELIQETDTEGGSATGAPETRGSARGAAGASSSAPTPFATAPRPAGMPNKWGSLNGKDEDEKK